MVLLRSYQLMYLIRDNDMNFDQFNTYDSAQLKTLYAALVKPRMIEEKMLKLLRQGQVSKWFSGIGQEAASDKETAVGD